MKKLFIIFTLLSMINVFADIEVTKEKNKQGLKVDNIIIRNTSANILNQKIISVNRSTKVVTWSEEKEENTTHFYSINLGKKWTTAKNTSYEIMLKNYQFDPMNDNRKKISFELKNRDNARLFIVQFVTQGLKAYRDVLKSMNVEIYQFLPHHSYIVRMEPSQVKAVNDLEFVRWVGQMHAAYKMQPKTHKRAHGLGQYNIVVVSKSDKNKLIAKITALGGIVVNPTTGSLLLVAKLNSSQLLEVSHLDSVLWIEKDTPIEEDMDNVRVQGGANHIESKSGFSGIGINGHVLEGIQKDHEDFAANEHRKAPIAVGGAAYSSHGQKTFGEIFGSGKGNSKARGLLPDAQGFFTNYWYVKSAPPGNKEPKSRYELTERVIRDHKVMFQTASWGYARTMEYDARSAEMDDLIFHLDIPICQSQSNSGTRKSRSQAWSKNIISVGALRHFDNSNPEDDKWDGGASIGPATDGRIKPDLCAYFDQILTTYKEGYVWNFGGTSGATPIVAGHVGLTIQLWTDGIFGNKLLAPKEDRFANRPHATTVKALLINNANQYRFSGENHDRTRVHQGWGFPSVKNMLDLRKKILIVNEEDLLTNLETKVYKVNVANAQAELKLTLIWNEPAPAINSSKQLVNNLNLKVIDPNGVVYYGNNGLLQGTHSKPDGEADNINNVENIFIKNPASGTWVIEVIADELNVDNHLETTTLDADFALVVTGITK